MTPIIRADGADRRALRWETVLVTLLLIVTFIPFLSETLFSTKGEPREALVAVSMLNQNNWILPASFGTDIPFKPPMLAWCIAALGWLNGGVVTEYLSRLPSAAAAVIMLIAFFRFLARRTDHQIALSATLVCAGSLEVFRAAIVCRVDMLLTAFMVCAILAMYRSWEKRPSTWMPSLGGVLLMSGAVLTKGPVGMLLPCAILFLFRLVKRDKFIPTLVSIALSGSLSLLMPILWYIAAYHQGGGQFLQLVLEENFGRFTGGMTYDSHEHSVFYNFTSLLSGLVPWSLLLIIGLFGKPWQGVRFSTGNKIKALWSKIQRMPATELLSLIAAVVIFIFFCIPKSKRSVYLLPMYPFTAFFIALYIRRLCNIAPATVKTFGWILTGVGTLSSVSLILIISGMVEPFGSGNLHLQLKLLAAEGARILPALFCYLTLILSIGFGWILTKSSTRHCAQVAIVFTLAIYCMVQVSALPALSNYKSDRQLAQQIEKTSEIASQELYAYRPWLMSRFYTIGFYTGDSMKRFDSLNPESGLLLIEESTMNNLIDSFGKQYTFLQPMEMGWSGETRQNLLLIPFERRHDGKDR